MLYRKRAWDIMRSEFSSVKEDATLNQVIEALEESLVHYPDNNFVLVTGRGGKFIGGISMWSIIKAMGPDLLKKTAGDQGLGSADKSFKLACQLGAQTGIKKIIQKDIPLINPNDTLARVIEAVLDYRQGRAVVEEGGRVMGVVMLADIYKEIARNI